jgi:putative ABC transport system ATP-binding protein
MSHIDLSLGPGETVAVTGPSGSGKSTLLNLLGTLERPTTGEVRVTGIPTSGTSDARLAGVRARSIGFVLQQFQLLEHVSVLDNVAAGLLYRAVPIRDRRRRAPDALGLTERARHRPPQLSRGERQRVAIARAVVGQSALVLADEPTGNLDSATGLEILKILMRLADERTAVVNVTHDASMAASARREVRVRDGRVVADEATR